MLRLMRIPNLVVMNRIQNAELIQKLLGIFSNKIEIYHGRDVACYVSTNTKIGGNKLESKHGINSKIARYFFQCY